MNDIVLSAENLGKAYPLPKGELRVFQGIDFELRRGDLAAIMGMSGVGKTTLLNLLGTLDRPSEGTIRLDGVDLAARSDLEISGLRNRKIGFVFSSTTSCPSSPLWKTSASPSSFGERAARRPCPGP